MSKNKLKTGLNQYYLPSSLMFVCVCLQAYLCVCFREVWLHLTCQIEEKQPIASQHTLY